MKSSGNFRMQRSPRALWAFSGLFSALSLAVLCFLIFEMGLLEFKTSRAAEGGAEPEAQDGASQELEKLTNSVKEKSRQLDKREADLKLKEGQVLEKELVFNQQVQRYEQAIVDLKKKIASLESGNQSKADAFRQLYEKMDPKKVSQILEQMSPPLASYILAGMKPQLAAEILSKMTVPKIREITEKYLSKQYLSSHKKQVNEEEVQVNQKGGEK